MTVLLKNPTIADGVSSKIYISDILISDGVIVDIHPNLDAEAEAIDLTGLSVTPGFIDVHSHNDLFPISGEHKIRQGITTEITGNCGLGYFPMAPGIDAYLRAAGLPVGTDIVVPDYAAYREMMGKPVTKHVALVPHGNIRHVSGGDICRMQELLERCMDQGAIGMSAGLYIPPGSFADAAELMCLCAAVARYDGIFAVHLRDEFAMDQSLDECISLVEKTGVRLHISHIKAIGAANFGRAQMMIGRIEKARYRGLELTADCYPYAASMTGFAALAPDYAANIALRGGPDRIFVSRTSLQTLAYKENIPSEKMAERLARAGEAAIFACMDSADVDEFIKTPWVMIGTDGVLNPPIHPRTYGSFAKYIEVYVNRKKLLTLAEAVRKITSLPADVFRLSGCGRLVKGCRADLTVLDLPRVNSSADYTNPEIYPQGIEGVMIDGEWVYRKSNLMQSQSSSSSAFGRTHM